MSSGRRVEEVGIRDFISEMRARRELDEVKADGGALQSAHAHVKFQWVERACWRAGWGRWEKPSMEC